MSDEFRFTRSTFSSKEISVRYIHSHLGRRGSPYDYTANHIAEFRASCLGTGPIGSIITLLMEDGDSEDFLRFVQFFTYLDEYLAWESLEGVPYIKMSVLSEGESTNQDLEGIPIDYCDIDMEMRSSLFNALTPEYLQEILSKCSVYTDANTGMYVLDYDELTLGLELTERTREWHGGNSGFMREVRKDGLGRLTYFRTNRESGRVSNISNLNNSFLFRFKGKDIKLKLLDANTSNPNQSMEILSPKFIRLIINQIEEIINGEFSKKGFNASQI